MNAVLAKTAIMTPCRGPGCRRWRSSKVPQRLGFCSGCWACGPSIAAAIGLIPFFAGALTARLRSCAFHNIAVPGTYFLLAIASAALAVTAS